jgi:YVTN family beta-propeller protein
MFIRTVMPRWLALPLLALLAACQAHAHHAPSVRPLAEEAEVFVYLRPLPPEAERLSFEMAQVVAVASDGVEVPLELRIPSIAPTEVARERLLAWGRVPPGRYEGLAIHVANATLAGEAGPAALLVPKEPITAALPFTAGRGTSTVISLAVRYPPSVERTFQFEPSFVAALPERAVPDAIGLSANAGMASLTVVDRRARRVAAVVPTGGAPRAIALDPLGRRAYVAVADDDAVQVLDVASGATVGRVRLSPGDRPWDLALAPDGRTLVVANQGTNTVSFVDVLTLAEVGRAPTGDAPSALVLDRAGRRAYVLDHRSNELTVLDVSNRAVVGTVPTDPEPLRAALDAAGRRLYVVHGGSAYMTILSLPDLAVAGRVFVGLGASGVLVDSRTNLVYVARGDARRLDVYDPFSLAPVTTVDVPAPVRFMVIDDAENTLWALMPEVRGVAVLDLTTRATLATIDVGDAPAALAITGARP